MKFCLLVNPYQIVLLQSIKNSLKFKTLWTIKINNMLFAVYFYSIQFLDVF